MTVEDLLDAVAQVACGAVSPSCLLDIAQVAHDTGLGDLAAACRAAAADAEPEAAAARIVESYRLP